MYGTAVAKHAEVRVLLGFANGDKPKGWLARVTSAITHSPGLLEIKRASWDAKHGAEVFIPIARLRGEEGDLHVRYMIRVTSTCDDVFRANPTGQLFSRMGDRQRQGIHLVANLTSAFDTHSDTD